MSMTIKGPDGKPRCSWCSAAPEFFDYHDTEWGFPVSDDHRLFEKLSLESFQSGLSWRTILAKTVAVPDIKQALALHAVDKLTESGLVRFTDEILFDVEGHPAGR